MDKKQAQMIIKETFESPFDKNKFVGFVKNLLNDVEEATFIYKGNYIPDAYEQYINTLERIGKYTDGEHKIDILIAKLKKETSIERARTMQRNFVAWYLNGSRGGELKDAALVAFVAPNEEDWRFSLVKMDYRFDEGKNGRMRVKEEFTPARRWSFLVGVNENSHTAQSQLVDLVADDERNPVLNQIEEAFNIEKVTKEFFEKYKDLFLRVKDALDELVKSDEKLRSDFKDKGVDTANFTKKLLGQIVFLYFLQKKGWFGVKKGEEWGTGSKRFFRDLFEGEVILYKNFFNDVLEPLFYDALALDRSHIDHWNDHFQCKIPFLNGGLFDPINNYSWEKTVIDLPNNLFSNDRKDLKTGDIGDGILDIFDRYNFTVKEDEPLEKEVAVDPEMLGKVFENLLEVKDRKSKGTYYTPREIVHYMCQQSLINYLSAELSSPVIASPEGAKQSLPTKEDIETFVKHGEQVSANEATVEAKGKETSTYYYKLPESIRQSAGLLDEKLVNIKVCDPAIGSGAFPVGMMGEIVKTRNVLSSYIKGKDRTIYNFKRECIEKSLYGVDIDPGAVEIAKLRLWLSLVVDEEDIKQIKPLPNLDYKIVCGDSLLGVEKNLFNLSLFTALERLKPILFGETNPKKKQECKKQIDDIIRQITNGHKEFDFEVYFSEVFHEKKGFDVVIANPPYVRVQNLSHKEIDLYKERFKSAYKRVDISILFLELAKRIMKKGGVSVYITSSQFTKTEYGRKIRGILLDDLVSIVYFGDNQVFENAINYTSLFIFTKEVTRKDLLFINAEKYNGSMRLSDYVLNNIKRMDKSLLSEEPWELDQPEIIAVLNKIRNSSDEKLKDVANIEYGLVTGLDKVFIFKKKDMAELVSANFIFPLITPQNTDRYHLSEPTYCVVYPYRRENEKTIIINSDELKEKSPHVYKYLVNNKKSLLERKDSRINLKNSGKIWYGLMRHSSFSKVARQKILTQALCKANEFCLDENGHFFTGGSVYSIYSTNKKISNNLLLGLLNSKVCEFYYQMVCPIRQNGYRFYAGAFLKSFPVPKALRNISDSIIDFVDKIHSIAGTSDYCANSTKQTKVKEYERQIDQMVYDLYGLTKEEIEIVEKTGE